MASLQKCLECWEYTGSSKLKKNCGRAQITFYQNFMSLIGSINHVKSFWKRLRSKKRLHERFQKERLRMERGMICGNLVWWFFTFCTQTLFEEHHANSPHIISLVIRHARNVKFRTLIFGPTENETWAEKLTDHWKLLFVLAVSVLEFT